MVSVPDAEQDIRDRGLRTRKLCSDEEEVGSDIGARTRTLRLERATKVRFLVVCRILR